ncbi:cytochrome c, partial [Acidobacteria bacterium AH-259-D05]|nr:cytochrome c [Acidobacteria bacterium AH-259-D05]
MRGNPSPDYAKIERWRGWKSRAKLLVVCEVLFLLPGCRGYPSERPPIHPNPNMDRQPKYLPQAESRFFYDGTTMQKPVPGTVARGDLRVDQEFYTGSSAWGFFIPKIPLEVSEEFIARGQERYQIYCRPCHGDRGDGQGMLFKRAGVETANLLEDRIRNIPDGWIYRVITMGVGNMPGYRYPIQPQDRWAIV